MSNPSTRLLAVAASVAVFIWIAGMIFTYLFGAQGLNIADYFSSTLWLLVWACIGFTIALFFFHTLTIASVPLFIPIAPPVDGNISTPERILIGIAQGYTSSPAIPPSAAPSLYTQALQRWNLMRGMPNTTPAEGIIALLSILRTISTNNGAPSIQSTLHILSETSLWDKLPPNDQILIGLVLTYQDAPELPHDAPPEAQQAHAKLRTVIQTVG